MSIDSKEDNIVHLENLIREENTMSFEPMCVRKKSNWSKSSNRYKFDHLDFDPETLLNDIPTHSPKLQALLSKIDELDKADMKKHGKLFKHFIFSDLKSNTYGTKLLASAFMAKGLNMGYNAEQLAGHSSTSKQPISKARSLSNRSSLSKSKSRSRSRSISSYSSASSYSSRSTRSSASSGGGSGGSGGGGGSGTAPKKEKIYKKMELLTDAELRKTKNNNFYLLSSISVFDQNITVANKKEILKRFNQRPENVNGELVRFIIMDSGFKEGIDLFDIKYIHIFEPSTVSADQKQVIGRGTRTCGQKGLDFHPTQGWPLHVFIYDLSIHQELRSTFLGSSSAIDLYLKTLNIDVRLFHFTHDLEKIAILGSVDYDLNKNIHSFSIPSEESDDEEFVYGGGDGHGDASETEDSEDEKPAEINDGISPIGYIGAGPKLKQPLLKKKLHVREDLSPIVVHNPSETPKTYQEMRDFVRENYSEFTWPIVKMENLCSEKPNKDSKSKSKGGSLEQSAGAGAGASAGTSKIMKYTPTQEFIRHFFTPANPLKGMLLWQSVGTGKTCSAIAAASSTFEQEGYTILWVTRTTLKNDIWKNMFEQICNESISRKITEEGLVVPDEQNKRMRLLSKSWRIRPMSYKQFSNMVSKQNAFYKTLVKINGEIDPLRKTLLIIDEAHKLYGGSDLSSLEQPDMNALHQALMHSYQLSGKDSVKLLLMTATPIAKEPMELIKLINLCKPIDRQLPDRFEEFSDIYLNETGEFSERGRAKFLDDIAGHISYLNREKDARQFAQPIIHHVNVPIVDKEGMDAAKKFDRKIVRDIMESDVSDLMSQIDDKNKELVGELIDIDPSKFSFLKEEICDGLSGKELKGAEKVANANIRELVAEAKEHVKQIRSDIKDLKDAIKDRNKGRKDALAAISGNREELEEEYMEYKGSLLYSIKNKCSTRISGNAPLREQIKEHPEVAQLDREIEDKNAYIRQLQERLKVQIGLYKSRITYLRSLLKTKLTLEEKALIRTQVKEESSYYRKIVVTKRKYNKKIEKGLKKEVKTLEKTRKKTYNNVKKTIKNQIRDEKKKRNEIKKEEARLRKTLRKQGELKEEITHDLLKNLTKKYRAKILEDMLVLDEKMVLEQHLKEEAVREKERLKEERAKERLAERERKAREKLAEKERVKREKEELRKTKKAKAEEAAQQKKAEKLANKTRKKNG